jgi:signal transduction histidine kinase
VAAGKRRPDESRPQSGPAAAEDSARIAELVEAVRARDDFLTVAAHELRNPMTPIAGQVELLLAAARSEGASPSIVEGLERLGRLVDTYIDRTMVFLDVARITSGKLRLDCRPVDLSRLVLDLTRSMMPAARRAGCRLDAAVEEDVFVSADRVAVEQILQNLLMNALKYGAGGVIELTLSADQGCARTTVRDEGPGIAPEDQRRIFEKFERAIANRGSKGGFGVGLWISNQLAVAMGGSIDISSAIGVGSAFTFRMPTAKS